MKTGIEVEIKEGNEGYMKNMLLVAILFVVQASFAAPARDVKPRGVEAHRTELTKDASYKELLEKGKTGKALTAKEKEFTTKAVNDALKGTSVSATNVILMAQVKPEILPYILAKSEIVKSSESTKEQKDQAELDLKVIESGGRSLDVNSASAKNDAEIILTVSKVENYANSTVASFKADFVKALENGKSIEASVTLASKGKFDAKKLKELCI
ncbi:MAG: hypothetical protein H7328_09270 [Bdellovibrio sp.]|nr:hypothetical protein [Bdellovibrio sp.]